MVRVWVAALALMMGPVFGPQGLRAHGQSQSGSPSFADAEMIALHGGDLTAREARALERRLRREPHDLTARTKLLGYYQRGQFGSEAARAAHERHALWVIANTPASSTAGIAEVLLHPRIDGNAYDKGKRLWIEHVRRHPSNTAVLGNAAKYFLLYDREAAEQCLRAAEHAEAWNPEWPRRLGDLYFLGNSDKTAEARKRDAIKAFTEYERAYALFKDKESPPAPDLLKDLARTAFDAGKSDSARTYAQQILRGARETSDIFADWDAIHHGNIVLGRLALQAGDLDEAKRRLIAAARVPGSPVLGSFGSNMALALELLQKGERAAVLDYLKQCRSFWDRNELAQWSDAIRAGRIPDFGANLDY